jgi:hypothetical protein
VALRCEAGADITADGAGTDEHDALLGRAQAGALARNGCIAAHHSNFAPDAFTISANFFSSALT